MHGFRMVLSPVFLYAGRTVAQYMFKILYKYHLFVLLLFFINRHLRFLSLIGRLSQMANMYLIYLGSTYLPFNISSGVIRLNRLDLQFALTCSY